MLSRLSLGCSCGCESRPGLPDPPCVTRKPIPAEVPAGHWPCGDGECVCYLIGRPRLVPVPETVTQPWPQADILNPFGVPA